jgi:hypothetical protein
MGDQAAGKTYATIVLEDEEAAQRFKEFVLGFARQERRDEGGVSNESFTINSGGAWRSPSLSP